MFLKSSKIVIGTAKIVDRRGEKDCTIKLLYERNRGWAICAYAKDEEPDLWATFQNKNFVYWYFPPVFYPTAKEVLSLYRELEKCL